MRLEVGVGPGGNLTAFTAFGLDSDRRHALFDDTLALLKTAWSGSALPGGDSALRNVRGKVFHDAVEMLSELGQDRLCRYAAGDGWDEPSGELLSPKE